MCFTYYGQPWAHPQVWSDSGISELTLYHFCFPHKETHLRGLCDVQISE